NEGPRHRIFLERFDIAGRLVTNSEYLEFIEDRGYQRPELWLSDGWKAANADAWSAPLYWEKAAPGDPRSPFRVFSLDGMSDLDPSEPVCHVSYYEADACARWAGARLATESEWEIACQGADRGGNFVESALLHPSATHAGAAEIRQMFGDTWEWT